MKYHEQEHRRHGRFRKEAPAWLSFRDTPEPCGATTLDLSPEGASFQIRSRVKPRVPVILKLSLEGHAPPLEAKGKVCWAAPGPDGTHQFGVRFLDLTEDERTRLGRFLADAGPTLH
jgi:hypothetical protein